jgi:hypothetical protein
MRFNQRATLAVLLSLGLSGNAFARPAYDGSHHRHRTHHLRHEPYRAAHIYSQPTQFYSQPPEFGRYDSAPAVDPYDGGPPP